VVNDDKARRPGESFADWRERLTAAKIEAAVTNAPQPSWDPNQWDPALIPQVRDDSERSEDDQEIDRALDTIDILDAYRVWCGKMTPDASGKTEGIMISCPNPSHRDSNPSAWINLDKQTYYCGGCDEGGDKFDIAAMSMGLEGYKNDPPKFMELRKRMASDFGWTVKKVPGGTMIVPPDEPNPQPDPEPSPEPSNVTPLHALPEPGEDEEEDETVWPKLPWRDIVPRDTFLWEYMQETSHDDSPEEYHFFHGLMALGHAGGRKVHFADQPAVYGNMLVCLLGGTGVGKSTSRRWLTEVLEEVLPFNQAMTPPSGVKQVVAAGSGEHLIHSFIFEQADPSTGIKTLQPVNGIVDYDEMARIVATMKAQRSTLKEVIMQMGDAARRVTAGSLTHGDKIAVEPFCTIATSTQPRTIRTMFSDAEAGSGFLNRWIFAAGPPKIRQSMGGRWATYSVDLSAAKMRLGHIKGWASLPKEVDFENEEAYLAWDDYFKHSIRPQMETDDTQLLKRLDLWHKKFMLLMAINERSEHVTTAMVERVKLMTPYILQCYSLLNENIGITRNKEIADEIMKHANNAWRKDGRGITLRDLGQRIKRKNWPDKQVADTIKVLVELEKLEIEKPPPGPGRRTTRYRVVGE
jgi:hypothetical protein